MNRPKLESMLVDIQSKSRLGTTYGGGLKSWKKLRLVLPAFFISKATLWPAGQENVDTMNELPGETVISPRSSATAGALLKVVEDVAGDTS